MCTELEDAHLFGNQVPPLNESKKKPEEAVNQRQQSHENVMNEICSKFRENI